MSGSSTNQILFHGLPNNVSSIVLGLLEREIYLILQQYSRQTTAQNFTIEVA